MKSLTRLFLVLLREIGAECGISIERDWKTILDRIEHEGMSFLTITLPTFATDFERSIELGGVTSDLFLSFKKKGGLPVFLSGFLRLVFMDSGELKDEPSVVAVRSIRQLTLFFKKVELECTDRRKRKAIQSYLACEEELAQVERHLDPDRVRDVAVQAHILFGDVFDKVNRLIDDFAIEPRHGSGSTADEKIGNQKFDQSYWTERLQEYFPYGEYLFPNLRRVNSWSVNLASLDEEIPAKVSLVKKTQKTPRIIAMEPTAMQYVQQGLMHALVPLLESDPLCGPFVGFSSQEENRDAARIGSITGEIATLDLSEASDRVLNSLVMEILRPWPSLQGAVMASRSQRVTLPDGTVLPLKKFASMGSALCFPMEEIAFLAIILSGTASAGFRRSRGELMALHGLVRVYGDDIIIPVDMVQAAVESLESFGLKVNATKSFWNGMFRESCGGDYFSGEWVTPVRMSRMLPARRDDVASVVSTMELCNRLYENGLWITADYLLTELRKLGYGRKVVPRYTAAIAPWSFQTSGYKWDRLHPDYHSKVVRVDVLRPSFPTNGVDGLPALRKTLEGDYSDPQYRHHLTSSGRPLHVRTKRGWVEVGA
jgi:hypothetical protein